MARAKFGTLPFRALRDHRLSGTDARVLACIGYHDRLSGPRGQGNGCTAGNEKIADECGLDPASLSRSISRLAEFGYISREPNPKKPRLRVFRVIYEAKDHLQDCKSNNLQNCKQSPAPADLHSANGSFATDARIICNAKGQPTESKSILDREYNHREDTPLKRRKNSSEDASLREVALNGNGRSENIGAYLAELERSLKSCGDEAELSEDIQERLCEIAEGGRHDDTLAQWANRILDQWGAVAQ